MTGRHPGEPIDVPSRGLAAPPDITGICGTDDLVEALSTRRSAHSQAQTPSEDDPAVRLLQSLIADVDEDAPPLPVARRSAATRAVGRRRARTIVVLGVTTALLTTTGVAAATAGSGGGLGGSLLRSAIVARQVTALQSRAELRNVCRAVIVGWYGSGRGARTRNRLAAGRTEPGRDAGVRSVRHVDRLSLRPRRDRITGIRPLRLPPIVRLARLRDQQRGQEFARPSSLSITPST